MRLIWLALGGVVACSGSEQLETRGPEWRVSNPIVFADTWLGGTADASLEIESTGSSPVRLLRVTSQHDDVTVDAPSEQELERGRIVHVPLRFVPTQVGSLSTTVTVETDAGSQVVTVLGQAHDIPSCDDLNTCTTDEFDLDANVCTYTRREGACDDGNACTTEDTCTPDGCRGAARSCNDDNPCTVDGCDAATGCVHQPSNACDDGDPCTVDLCDAVDGCSSAPAPDNTSCGTATCAAVFMCISGACESLPLGDARNGDPCDDGDACTDADTCLAGVCEGGPRRTTTTVLSETPIFGGHYTAVTNNGDVIVASTRSALDVLTVDGTDLTHRSRTRGPAFLGVCPTDDGRFVGVLQSGLVRFTINGSYEPETTWDLPVVDPARPTAEDTLHGNIRVHCAAGGVVIHGALVSTEDGSSARRGLAFIPVDATGPLPVVRLSDTLATYVATSANAVAWVGQQAPTLEAHWSRLSSTGTIEASATFTDSAFTNGVVVTASVDDHYVALAGGVSVRVFDMSDAQSGPFAPPVVATLDIAIFSQAHAIDWPWFYVGSAAFSDGIGYDRNTLWAFDLRIPSPPSIVIGKSSVLPRQLGLTHEALFTGGAWLWRNYGVSQDLFPVFDELWAPGLAGEVRTLVELGEGRVGVLGEGLVGELDADDGALNAWRKHAYAYPVMRGARGFSQAISGGSLAPSLSAGCASGKSFFISAVTVSGPDVEHELCVDETSTSLDHYTLAGTYVFATVRASLTSASLMAWDLVNGDAEPRWVMDLPVDHAASSLFKASNDHSFLYATSHIGPGTTYLWHIASDFTVTPFTPQGFSRLPGREVFDGELVLGISDTNASDFFSSTSRLYTWDGAWGRASPVSMRDGRLISVWQAPGLVNILSYDATAATLIDTVDYTERQTWPIDVLDLGDRLVIATPEALEVVAPACLPE